MRVDTVPIAPAAAGYGSTGTRLGWEACLQLGFVCDNGKTVLKHRRHQGPLLVQRPFYHDDGLCHVYLIHPPGGIVAGDRLAIDVSAAAGAEALLTTPAAGKFYQSFGEIAEQSVTLKIAGGAVLEWLPQETIIFEAARVHTKMHIDLDSAARFIGWEIVTFGRPAASESFAKGCAQLDWRINREGKTFYLERLKLDSEAFFSCWGLNGLSSCGTLFAYPATSDTLAAVQQLIADAPGRGVTRMDDMLVCRAIDAKGDRLRAFFQQVWTAIRQDIVKRPAHSPRIWST
jgi:urease accessory protein